jgi:predicted secreted protein
MVESIHVREHDSFELRFPGNPKAGFLWKVAIPPYQADCIVLVKPPAWEPNPSQVGGPILQIFSFRALKTATVTLTFTYQRGFGKDRTSEDRIYEVFIGESDGHTSAADPTAERR